MGEKIGPSIFDEHKPVEPYRPSTFLMGDFYLTPQERSVYRVFGRFFKKMKALEEKDPEQPVAPPTGQENSE
ncbi:MAG: hypothetical protein NTY75_01345 [Candidatus Shapirobacteria bacterium]|nr:hypothetical protein [Candidatus Shapirobacteria bacterium]MCX6789493.1 hypothetical protein [Candidatus Gribaldobacteria bacterium]